MLPAWFDLIVFLFSLALFVIGWLLLRRGLRGSRGGDEPYCKKCDYNLTGLTSQKCPECGAVVTPETVAFGVRQRRPGYVVAGTMLLLVALGIIGPVGYRVARKIDWHAYAYHFYPADTLLRRVKSDDRRATDELYRRVQNTSLTEKQKSQFYEELVSFELKARPRIRQGDALPVQIIHKGHGSPGVPWEHSWRKSEVRIDGQLHSRGGGVGSGPLGRYGASFSRRQVLRVHGLEPGTHTVEVTLKSSLFEASGDPDGNMAFDPNIQEPFWSKDILLAAEFEVLGPEELDPLRLINDPGLVEVLQNSLEIRHVGFQPWGGDPEIEIRFTTPVPMDLAFNVMIEIEDREVKVGTISCAKGTRNHVYSVNLFDLVWDFDAEQIDVILRTSREVASRTIDCFDVWDGELRFDGVEVTRPSGRFSRSAPRSADKESPEERMRRREQQYREELANRRERLGDEHPETLESMERLAAELQRQGKLDGARDLSMELIAARRRFAEQPDAYAAAVNKYARILLTCGFEDLRDVDTALVFAKKAVKMTRGKNPNMLDTLALGYHLIGDHERALHTQEQAVDLLLPGDSPHRTEFEARLAEYRAMLPKPNHPAESSSS